MEAHATFALTPGPSPGGRGVQSNLDTESASHWQSQWHPRKELE